MTRAHEQNYGNPLGDSQGGALNGTNFAGLLNRQGNSFRQRARWCLSWALFVVWSLAWGQTGQNADTVREVPSVRRLCTVIGGGAIVAGTLVSLDRAWYSQYDRSSFHLFNDGGEWLQMDKVGHSFATYTVGKWGYSLMRWCEYPEKASVWAGGTLGLAYLTAVEYMDGRSAEWGFSTWDMAANVAGTGLFIGQQLGWKEQRITMKYSAHLTDYALQRPNVLGDGLSERILKDYNGCTFWLSANASAFGMKRVPHWLNMAVGYGAEGMLYADRNNGQYRQFYLSPDIDLQRIPTKSRALRTLFLVLNCVKVPMPALELTGRGDLRGHWLYF